MPAAADYRADIGYTKLQQDLGGSIPNGAGVVVSQVEGEQTMNGNDWMPDVTNGEFVGKTIINASGAPAGVYSGHATPVGQAFYGTVTSMTPAITNISAWSAEDWVGPGFLITIVGSGGARPIVSTTRVANHSWVGSATTGNTYVLRRADWLVETDEFILVVGAENNPGIGNNSTSPLLASGYNVIAVGLSSGLHGVGGVALDSTYVAGRSRPDIVAPASSTSIATPYVSAAAALLVQFGNVNPGLSQGSMTNRANILVRNAERSEVIKAALMAGADRVTHNSTPYPTNLAGYRGTVSNQTANGLDRRYGAGQLNIRNSYWIIAGGEQSSTQDGNMAPTVGSRGFDYDPGFGGNGTNATATYPLPVANYPRLLTASLAWNLDITGSSGNPNNNFDPAVTTVCSVARTLCDLNLALIDLANGDAVIASSAGTIDNTENLWIVVPPNAQYALRVTKTGNNFNWDYGLAWQLLQDADADGAYDDQDNCINIANFEQVDSDADGYGNHCDGDFNNNTTTNSQDYVLLKLQLGQPSTPPTYNQCDINVNGFVNAQDYILFRGLLALPSGPSGLVP